MLPPGLWASYNLNNSFGFSVQWKTRYGEKAFVAMYRLSLMMSDFLMMQEEKYDSQQMIEKRRWELVETAWLQVLPHTISPLTDFNYQPDMEATCLLTTWTKMLYFLTLTSRAPFFEGSFQNSVCFWV